MTAFALDRIALEQVTKSVDSVSYLQKDFSRLANMPGAATPSLVNGIDDGGADAEIMSSLAHCWDNKAAAVVEPREDAVSWSGRVEGIDKLKAIAFLRRSGTCKTPR